MKFSVLALLALVPFAMAAATPKPIAEFDGNSKCEVQGFKISFTKVNECCLKNMGGSNFKNKTLYCTLPIGDEGLFRKCVKDLGYATSVECEY